jgi:hypothetical protein
MRVLEGQEAIYIEKGAARVRVSRVYLNLRKHWISATITLLSTPGMPDSQYINTRWEIRAGYLTRASTSYWTMGYGGWTLYFDPAVVEGVTALAQAFAEGLSFSERYKAVNAWITANVDVGKSDAIFIEPYQ